MIKADPTLIDQVLVNLVVNARDAMPHGGKLTVTTRRDHAVIDGMAPSQAAGACAIVEIDDTGTGIPVAVRDRIFEPFFTTKHAGKGTGLGLATAYGIARQLGGMLTFTTEDGRGTAFRLTLPLTDEQPPAKVAQQLPSTPSSAREAILVVEDDGGVLSVVRQFLAESGYHVREASSGTEALAILDAESVDLVLADLRLSDMSGLAVARRARAHPDRVRVLLMSGYEQEPLTTEFSDVPFVRKPFRREELEQRIRDVLDRPVDRVQPISISDFRFQGTHETLPVGPWRHTELRPERAVEVGGLAEAAVERDVEDADAAPAWPAARPPPASAHAARTGAA